MKADDFEQFGQMLVAVADLYGKSISEFALGLYFKALKDFELPVIQQALERYIKNPDSGQFMPKPADLIRMLQGSSIDSSMAAWAKVDKAVRQVGSYASVVFDDALIHRVIVDMGGWVSLGTKTEDEWPFVQRDFQNLYKGYAHRSEQPEYDPVLIGMSDLHNTSEGFAKSPPRLIGDTHQAQLVMQSGTSTQLKVVSLSQAIQKKLGAA